MPRVLYIDPVSDDYATREYLDYLNAHKGNTVKIDAVALNKAPSKHITFEYYEALAAEGILHTVKQAENDGYDICIIGCFYDPFLAAAREITNRMVVVAPAEASMHIASVLADTFSIIVPVKKCIPLMKENVFKCGFDRKLASFRSLDIDVEKVQEDMESTKRKIYEQVKSAITIDGAESIILGCTEEYGMYKQLQEEYKIPVIDPVVAALKFGEFLYSIQQASDWYFSKVNKYQSPPLDEILDWEIEDMYGVPGLWDANKNN